MDPIHIDAVVRGRVQGVWYRRTAMHMARSLGLCGYAMNQPDGTVRIEVEGPAVQVHAFLAWCARGPSNARVTAVDHTRGVLKGYREFEVRR